MGEVKEVVVKQAEIEVGEYKFTVTHIPTATSGRWFVIHDAFEMWGAVAIEETGEVVGWRNPPGNSKTEIEKGIKKAFGIPEQER